MDNKITITIESADSKVSVTASALNIEEYLQLFEDAMKGSGFIFNGKLIIEETDDD